MSEPNPLPRTLPIGTKINRNGALYTSKSIGVYLDNEKVYHFEIVNRTDPNADIKNIVFYPSRILWDELPNESTESKEEVIINLTTKCSWCSKEIDNGMLLCSSHQSKCQKYYDVLSERMALSYLKPKDAHEYDRECVKVFVDNNESK